MIKILAFILRDLAIASTYKLSFFFRFFGIFFSILIFYFINRLFGEAASPHLEAYGGDYFSFVLIGLAFYGYMWVGLRSFSSIIRREQMLGTLEAMLVTPTNISVIVFSSSLWNFLSTSLGVIVYLLVGKVLFGIEIGNVNLPAVIILLTLTILTFSSLGIISASFILAYKQGDPVTGLFTSVSSLFGGVFFPVTVLPAGLQNISYVLPITYSLRGVRLALLQGYSLEALIPEISVLLIFTAIFLPLGIVSFNYAVKKAKTDGTLTHY